MEASKLPEPVLCRTTNANAAALTFAMGGRAVQACARFIPLPGPQRHASISKLIALDVVPATEDTWERAVRLGEVSGTARIVPVPPVHRGHGHRVRSCVTGH